MIGKKTLIAISAAMAFGMLGAASSAWANDGSQERGGFVVPGSMVGVNPVYHPGWFGKTSKTSNAGSAYGYAVAPIDNHYDRTPIDNHYDRTESR